MHTVTEGMLILQVAIYLDPPGSPIFPYFFPVGNPKSDMDDDLDDAPTRGHKNDLLLRKRTQMRSPTKQQRILRLRRRWER